MKMMNADGVVQIRIGKDKIAGRKAVRKIMAGAAKVSMDEIGERTKGTTAVNKKCRGRGVAAV